MRIEADSRGRVRRVALRGEIDNLNAEALMPHLAAISGTPPVLVVLDLCDLTLITSAGLGHLIGFVKSVRSAGGQVAFARPAPVVKRTATRLGLEEILAVVETVEEAIGVLGESTAETAAPTRRVIDADRHLLAATGILFRPEAEDRVPEDRRAYAASGRIEERWPDHLRVSWRPSEFGSSEREFGARDIAGALSPGCGVRLVYRSEGGGRDTFDERFGKIEHVTKTESGAIDFAIELYPEE